MKLKIKQIKSLLTITKSIGKLRPLVNKKLQIKLIIAAALFIISSLFELGLIIFIIPLISSLTGTSEAISLPLLTKYLQLKIDTSTALTIFIAVLVSSALFRLLALKFQAHVTTALMTEISSKCFSGFIRGDIEIVNKSSFAGTQNIMTRQLDLLSGGVISPLFNLINAFVLCSSIIIGVILLQIKGVFIVGFCVILSFAIPFIISRKKVKDINKNFHQLQVDVLENISTTYELYIPIRVQNKINVQEKYFTKTSQKLWQDKSELLFLAQYPRITSETSLLLGIAFLIIISEPNTAIVADFSALALAGLKLIPAFQAIYNSVTIISAYKSSLDQVLSIALRKHEYLPDNKTIETRNFKNLYIKNLSFSYSKNSQKLSCPEFTLNNASIVGISGISGSGKSTIIKAFIGLYKNTQFEGYLNHKRIKDAKSELWPIICYTAQSTYLNKSTFSENISFLTNYGSELDTDSIKTLSNYLNVIDLYQQENIGENGSLISGGQRQRIALLRSFCANKPITILDEPTSSLDKQTETKILHCLKYLREKHNKTFIIISHSSSVLDECDTVYTLDRGTLLRG